MTREEFESKVKHPIKFVQQIEDCFAYAFYLPDQPPYTFIVVDPDDDTVDEVNKILDMKIKELG